MPEKPDLRRGSRDCIYPAPKSALWESRVGQRAVVWRVFGGGPVLFGVSVFGGFCLCLNPIKCEKRGQA